MFEEVYKEDQKFSPKKWIICILLSGVFYFTLFFVVSAVKGPMHGVTEETKKVDVEFVEEVIKEPEPKPVAPVIPKEMKVVQVDEPLPPPKELVAPIEIPDAPPKEADPSMDKGIKVYGAYDPNRADPLGLEGGMTEPIRLPEKAIPPKPYANNPKPEYPIAAKKRGLTGTVLLKVVIDMHGNVTRVEVVRGEEPFSSAAVKAVKKWKYKPAYFEKNPITVYRIIKIPFKLAA
jgi:protein TonB